MRSGRIASGLRRFDPWFLAFAGGALVLELLRTPASRSRILVDALPSVQLFLLVAAAVVASGRVFALRGGAAGVADFGEVLLRRTVIVVLAIGWATLIAGLLGRLRPGPITLATAALLIASQWRLPAAAPLATPKWEVRHAILIAPALLLAFGLAASAVVTPNSWDAMTYHVYVPARWVQEGRLFHVPTVFGDNAAAFAPGNWWLLMAALLALLGSDWLLNGVGVAFLVFGAACACKTAMRLGAGEEASLWGAAALACAPLLVDSAFSANADAMTLGFLLGATYWSVCLVRQDEGPAAWLASLCCGLALGTKTVALVWVLPLWALLVAVLAARRRWARCGASLLLLLVSGGGWYLLNVARYGNPLFPVSLSLGGVPLLPGAYDASAVRAGEYHARGLAELASGLHASFGGIALALVPLGMLGLGMRAARGDRGAGLVLALLLWWLAAFVFVVPHNLVERFFHPVFAASVIGVAALGASFRSQWLARSLLCAVVAVFAARGFAAELARVRAVGGMLPASLVLLALSVAAGAAFAGRRGRRVAGATLAIAAIGVAGGLAGAGSERLRARSLAVSRFAPWIGGVLPFNDGRIPPATIAYSGLNIPYALVGPRLRNEVVYCNVQGSLEDGFYEHWRRDPRRYAYHKPGLYRSEPSYPDWLENLRAARVDYLVTFLLYPAERSHLAHTRDGFPIEDLWAREHPALFLARTPGAATARIYRVRPPRSAAP